MFRVPDLQRILDIAGPGVQRLKAEFFTDGSEATATTNGSALPSVDSGAMAGMGALFVIGVILFLGFGLFVSVGAAKLSWCYNSYLGTGTGMSILYALLAFWFNTIYYPYYAWFINPYCNMKSPVAVASTIGGRRRR